MSQARNPTNRPEATVRTRREVPHPPARVFAAFAAPVLLARWWGPDGFTSTFETFEFRPGGRWTFVMHGPDGAAYPNESVFDAVDEPSRVVIRHLSPPAFVLTVTLAAAGDGTIIDWVQEFADPAVAARMRPLVEPANEQNLDRLQAVLGDMDA